MQIFKFYIFGIIFTNVCGINYSFFQICIVTI